MVLLENQENYFLPRVKFSRADWSDVMLEDDPFLSQARPIRLLHVLYVVYLRDVEDLFLTARRGPNPTQGSGIPYATPQLDVLQPNGHCQNFGSPKYLIGQERKS